jgi:radical SAM superfamily enzyme YgiQ (UPF0313 family)
MKILFSNPPWFELEPGSGMLRRGIRAGSRWPFTVKAQAPMGDFRFGDYLPYPFFLGYATSYCAKHTGAEVVMRDSIALYETYHDFYNFIHAEKFDFIFIESASPSWSHDETVIRNIKRFSPDTKVAVCGPITHERAEEIMASHPNVVACVQGEYEKGSVQVVNGAVGIIRHQLLTPAEMNEAPFPHYDMTMAHRYYDGCPIRPKGVSLPHAHVWASRGCSFRCLFCLQPAIMTGNDPDGTAKRSVRFYSPDYVERMLRHLIDTYGFQSFYFDDDTFNLGNRQTQGICAVMKRVGKPWSAMCRADTSTEETWQMMKDSGCYGVKLGYESGSQRVVNEIVNKGLDLEEARKTTHFLKSIGMTVHGTFMSGLPGETKEDYQTTLRYIESLPLDSFQHSGCSIQEGTPLATLRDKGHLENYPGAVEDENYKPSSDGQKKIEAIKQELARQ